MRFRSIEVGTDGRLVAAADGPTDGPPLRPGKIVAIGLNYRDHAREAGIDLPERPLVFVEVEVDGIGTLRNPVVELPSAA